MKCEEVFLWCLDSSAAAAAAAGELPPAGRESLYLSGRHFVSFGVLMACGRPNTQLRHLIVGVFVSFQRLPVGTELLVASVLVFW